jgi:hypothetical protein
VNIKRTKLSSFTEQAGIRYCKWCRDILGWTIIEKPVYNEKKHMWYFVLEYDYDDIIGSIKKRQLNEKKYARSS